MAHTRERQCIKPVAVPPRLGSASASASGSMLGSTRGATCRRAVRYGVWLACLPLALVWAEVAAAQNATSVSATGLIRQNDDGAALTAPDMSAYQLQVAALQVLQQDQLVLQQQEQARAAVPQQKPQNKPHPPALRKVQAQVQAQAAQAPYLVNLTGVGEQRRARVGIPGYGEITVQAGDVLPDRWRINAIDDDGVVVETNPGQHLQRLAYQQTSQQTPQQTSQQTPLRTRPAVPSAVAQSHARPGSPQPGASVMTAAASPSPVRAPVTPSSSTAATAAVAVSTSPNDAQRILAEAQRIQDQAAHSDSASPPAAASAPVLQAHTPAARHRT